MKYLTGIHALNIPCSLDTPGDWHQGALRWDDLTIKDSDNSINGSWGIESQKTIPFTELKMPVANHIRALLDMIEDGDFSSAEGMNKNFISNERYDIEIFDRVSRFKALSIWDKIDDFMGKEYLFKWLNYKKEMNL